MSVLGEGRLRVADGRTVAFLGATILAPNASGLLADPLGRPVLPQIRLVGAFAVTMNGSVTVAGRSVGRLVLQRADGEIGFPGDGTFGVLQVTGGKGEAERGNKAASSITAIFIHPRNEVDGDRILLRDVADLAGDRDTVARLGLVDLGATPALGSRRTLARWSLLAVLRDQGVAATTLDLRMPPDATVARRGQCVEPKTIVDAATTEARKAFGDVELQIGRGPAPLDTATGSLTLDTTSQRTGDKIAVTVRIRVDGRLMGEREVDFSALLDRVRSGDAVRVRLQLNGAVVETDARAKTGGFVGEAISVVTADGATLTATVTGAGRVEVKL